jgi:hypothetical protein
VRAASDSLALLEQGRLLIAQARTTDDVKQIRDQAAAVERYFRQQKYALEVINDAGELKVRAERRLGELLAETVRAGNPQLLHDATITRLPEGVTRSDSHRWQRVAGLPEDIFEAVIAAGRQRGDLSTNTFLKLAKQKDKERKDDEARQRMAEAAPPTDLIRVGDFREVLADLSDESVDMIFTDPPYAKEKGSYPLYRALAEFGSRVLKPGGSLIAYAPTYALADILPLMVPHLRYWNSIIVKHTGQSSRLDYFRTIVKAKCLLWFVKKEGRYEGEWVFNLIRSQPPNKQLHEWAQSEAEARYCIEKMTPPAGLIVDPMCGSATTLRAAMKLGRRTLGCEIDSDRAKVAAVRCDLRAEAATFNPPGWTPWQRAVWLGLLATEMPARAVECCPAEYAAECCPEPRLGRGNRKVGRTVSVFNLPVFDTCPGKTPSCEANCYADKGHFRWPDTKRLYAENLRAAKSDKFVEKIIAKLRKRRASKVRIHSSGDFFSPEYVLKWFAIASALPNVKFWCYTRSWRMPDILPELVRLASLSNVRVWFSCDRDTGLPAAVPNVQAWWLQIEDEEPPVAEPGQMAIPRAFRTKRKDRKPANRIGLAMICPTYTGLKADAHVTCETCRICFR